MPKKPFIILSLIASLLSLLYIIAEYFGYIRYYQNKLYSTDYYLEKYSKLERSDKERVIIHFVASINDLENIKPFLNSLLDQTVKVDEIAVSIPYNDRNKIPPHLKNILSVYTFNKDYGDSTKLTPILLREKNGKTKIIIVEPNIMYGKDFIEQIVEKSNKNPSSIIHDKDYKEFLIKPELINSGIENYSNGTSCIQHLKKNCDKDFVLIEYGDNFTF